MFTVAGPFAFVSQSVRALGHAVSGSSITLPLAAVPLYDLWTPHGVSNVDLGDKTRLRTLVAAFKSPPQNTISFDTA